MGEQAQGVAADAKLAEIAAAAASELAAVAIARRAAAGGQQIKAGTGLHALLKRELEILAARTQRFALGTELVAQLLHLLVAIDAGLLSHGDSLLPEGHAQSLEQIEAHGVRAVADADGDVQALVVLKLVKGYFMEERLLT